MLTVVACLLCSFAGKLGQHDNNTSMISATPTCTNGNEGGRVLKFLICYTHAHSFTNSLTHSLTFTLITYQYNNLNVVHDRTKYSHVTKHITKLPFIIYFD